MPKKRKVCVMRRMPAPYYAKKVAQLGLLSLVVVAVYNYQFFINEYAFLTFKPDQPTSVIESNLNLTRNARGSLYLAKPQLDSKVSFNGDCQTEPHELELGCYYRGRIFVLKIDNSSLAPEMNVVTAHELLHAVWNSMSPGERKKLEPELMRVYNQVADDDLRERMAGYAKSEPGEQFNELHSILGTEFSELSPMLEAHYRKYFDNRMKIVGYQEVFKNVFTQRRQELETQLANIRSEKSQLAVLNRRMELYKTNNQISSYNSLVPDQNDLVDTINSHINVYQSGVDEYNSLSKSIDSQQITDTESAAQ